MAVLLDMTRAAAEESLIIKWGGLPASFRWRGRMYDVAELHAEWEDHAGRTWYRVESEEGHMFLLRLQIGSILVALAVAWGWWGFGGGWGFGQQKNRAAQWGAPSAR